MRYPFGSHISAREYVSRTLGPHIVLELSVRCRRRFIFDQRGRPGSRVLSLSCQEGARREYVNANAILM